MGRLGALIDNVLDLTQSDMGSLLLAEDEVDLAEDEPNAERVDTYSRDYVVGILRQMDAYRFEQFPEYRQLLEHLHLAKAAGVLALKEADPSFDACLRAHGVNLEADYEEIGQVRTPPGFYHQLPWAETLRVLKRKGQPVL